MLLSNSSNIVASRGRLIKVNEPTDAEFNLFRDLVLKDLGMEWGDDKKYLLYARVQRILQERQLETFQSYYDYIEREENRKELQLLYNAVTTTKSGFYREKQHFKFIRENVFPEMKDQKSNQYSKLRFWSAGCSSGEETYTLAMEAHDFFGTSRVSNGGLRILGSDVNTGVLEFAINGGYTEEQISTIPDSLKKRFLVQASVGQIDLQRRINKDIQKLIQFRQFNLMATAYPIATKFQLIFCRNLLYYLHPKKREYLLKKLVDNLEIGGWLVLGITETGYKLDGMKKLAFSIYQKD
ncbi:MAG: CheR family methyltransferase [bacterium]|jgi:chemotaxis protein methyltransferase CheR